MSLASVTDWLSSNGMSKKRKDILKIFDEIEIEEVKDIIEMTLQEFTDGLKESGVKLKGLTFRKLLKAINKLRITNGAQALKVELTSVKKQNIGK